MRSREDLHEILCTILGSRNVYFQPPPTVQMKYPCIVYKLNDIDVRHADDKKYLKHNQYFITAISKDPDSDLKDKILELPYSDLNNSYTADNLNHWVITVYF